MKIATRDIERTVKAIAPFRSALLYGPDAGLARQRQEIIIAQVMGEHPDPLNKIELTTEALADDPTRLFDEVNAFSLMGGRRCILLRDVGDKLTKDMTECLEMLDDNTFVLMVAGELAARSSLRKLAESHPQCAALPCYKDEGAGLARVIEDTLRGYGLSADREVIQYLADNLGGDRQIIFNELEKLSLYMGDDASHVDISSAMAAIGGSNEETIDAFCNYVASGASNKAIRALDRLTQEGSQPIILLRSLQRYYQRLYSIHSSVEDGHTVDQAVKSLRPPVFFKQVPIITQHAKRWHSKKTLTALQLIQNAEAACKGMSATDDTHLVCSQLVMQLSRAA